jgi:hypothetical protein
LCRFIGQLACYDVGTNEREDIPMKKWGLFGIVFAILYFPIGVILALAKNYR